MTRKGQVPRPGAGEDYSIKNDAEYRKSISGSRSFETVTADSFTLLLDLDSPVALAGLQERVEFLGKIFPISGTEIWPSKTRGHHHARITLGEALSPSVRLALQAALGSDWRREMHGIQKLQEGVVEPSWLARPVKPVESKNTGVRATIRRTLSVGIGTPSGSDEDVPF